jgi:hypothetical protein
MTLEILGTDVLAWMTALAVFVGTGSAERSGRVVRVVLPEGCACAATTTPRPGSEAGCDCVETTVVAMTNPVHGVCELAGCEQPRGCVMAERVIKVRLKLDEDCLCEKATVSGTGAESGIPEQTITDEDNWSDDITLGGHALDCSSFFSSIDSGSIKIECTSGGTPVPRTLCSFGFGYACVACGS